MTEQPNNSAQRWWDWPAAFLIILAAIIASTRLAATGWTNNLQVIQTIAFLGVILGLALGQSRFSARLAVYLALAYGLFTVPWQLGQTIQGVTLTWSERMDVLFSRLGLVISQLGRQQAVQDSVLFLLLMGFLFWALSVHAGYILIRYGQAWAAILPMGAAMAVVHSFDNLIERRVWYLGTYIFVGLVLVARMAYLEQHNRWQQTRTTLPPQLGFDFIRFALIVATVVVLLAWTVPALAQAVPAMSRAIDPLRQEWYEVRDRMDGAFASLRASVGIASDYYGANVQLGRGNRLSDAQMFLVRPPKEVPAGVRFYWRARVYDTYLDGQWLSTQTESQPYNPDEQAFRFPILAARWQGIFEFITADDMSTVFTAAQPLWFSMPGTVHLISRPDDTVELASVRASPALQTGTLYAAESSLSSASVLEMRQSGSDYPDFIRETYTALPDEISERTRQLAEQLTAGQDNPYDKVMAVTNYLRDNMTYQEIIPEVPIGSEAVDWFLFDYQKGFCNYYATSQVVLLRAAGIPARFSIGYAQGETLEDGNLLVRQREAHAWPEVYFAGLGWIEFEPTVSQPAIERLAEPIIQETVIDSAPPVEDTSAEEKRDILDAMRDSSDPLDDPQSSRILSPLVRIVLWGLAIALAAGMLLAAWLLRERLAFERLPLILESGLLRVGIVPPGALVRWAQRARLSPLSKAYLEINTALRWVGQRPAHTDTPAERAGSLGGALPPAKEPAERLLHEYELGTFSPHPADEQTAIQAGTEIRRLGWRARLRRVFSRLQEKPGK